MQSLNSECDFSGVSYCLPIDWLLFDCRRVSSLCLGISAFLNRILQFPKGYGVLSKPDVKSY